MTFGGTIDGGDGYEPFEDGHSRSPGARRGPRSSREPKRVTPLGEAAMDSVRARFLEDLDSSDVSISDWEADFVGSNVERKSFTEGQRKVIDKLRKKYERKL